MVKEEKSEQEMIIEIEQILSKEPKNHGKWSNLAFFYFKISNYDKAIDAVKTAINLDEENARYHFLAAVIFSKAKNHSKVIEHGQKHLDLNGEEAVNASLLIGDAYIGLEKPDLAIPQLQKFINHDESYPDAWKKIGFCYLQLGKHITAEKCLLRAIDLGDEDPGTLTNLGICQFELYKNEEALKNLEQAMELAPEMMQPQKVYAMTLVEAKKYEEAEKISNEFLRKYPNDSDILFSLGTLYFETSRKDEAKIVFDKALRLDPHNETLIAAVNAMLSTNN